jgi:hypothetical protein
MAKNYQDFKKLLFNPKLSKKTAFETLKSSYSFEEQQSVLKHLPKSFLPFLGGDCLIKSKEILGNSKDVINYDFRTPFDWYCLQVQHYKIQINQFLSLREEFEKNFLLGRYNESGKILNDVNDSISYSLWALENEFLQVQFEKGLEFNFKLLNASQQLNVTDRALNFLIHFFSVKVEEDISFFNYQTSLNSSYNSVPRHYVNFFNYRLNPMNHLFDGLNDLFSVHSNYSILDRYLLMRNVLAQLSNEDNSDENRNYCKDRSRFLSQYIDDSLLLKVNLFFDDTQQSSKLIDLDKDMIIDLYTKGEYILAINESKKKLLHKPNDFSTLEIFVKSHIHAEIDLGSIAPNPCFLDDTAKLLYKYLSKDGDPNEYFVELLTQANAISNFDFSQEITSFLERNRKIDYFNNNKRAYFYSKSLNPFDYQIFKKNDQRKRFLIDTIPKSTTGEFFLMLNNPIKYDIFKEVIPDYRRLLYIAITCYVNGEIAEAKNYLEQILPKCSHAGFLFEVAVDCLFKCYVELKDLDSAIDLYVTTYLKNEMLVSRIDSSKAVEIIISQNFRSVNHNNINFPIFIYFTPTETHTKFIAYDLFMRSINASKPTELTTLLNNIGSAEILFLKSVATSKIISRKAMVFRNSLQVIKERIEICQTLSKIDRERIEDYSKEISELTKRLTVQQRIKEIDQSMIYVDENGIIGHELTEINKGFNRFRSISELLNLNKIDATGISYDALKELMKGNIDRDTYKKSIRKTDIHFEHFTELFIQIRDKFLFSNHYGLDYYLSQRIRHGTIIGQLRKQFQELNLVTSKSSDDGDYLPNRFWSDQQLELQGNVKQDFENRMAGFSRKIDELIIELKDNFIQIKTEDAKTIQTGWFDYMYIPNWHRDTLYSLFVSKIQLITDFNEFVTIIFDVLWDMTATNLNNVRNAIDEDVKVLLIHHLDELESDLMVILKDSQPGKILKNIADCRTNIQAEVDTVIRWFNKSKNDEIDFTLADAFNTSLAIVNNINSPFLISFNEQLESKTPFKGAYFTHFVDLLKIFITNISNYFKENDLNNRTATVHFILNDDKLIVDFSNHLADIGSQETLLVKIEDINKKLLSANYSAIRGEGKSGFYKANNILKNVFRDLSNELIFNVTNDTFNVKLIISVKNLLV